MLSFILSDHNLFFSIALSIVVLLCLIEAGCVLTGISLMGLLTDAPDLDGPDVSSFGSWLALDKVPFMVWMVLVLTVFGLSGLSVNYLAWLIRGELLPQILTVPLALVAALVFVGRFATLVARILPQVETSALSSDSFTGMVAEMTMGQSRRGSPSEARFRDTYHQLHYILVEPWEDQEQFHRGDRVILVQKKDHYWLATRCNLPEV